MILDYGPGMGVEIVTESSETVINQIISLGKAAYPIFSSGDKHSFYNDDLNNSNHINLVLKREGIIVGYLLAYPQDEACENLRDWDPRIPRGNSMYYVDTVQTMPDERNSGGFLILLYRLFEELRRRGVSEISGHLRQSNGFNRKIQKLFPDVRYLHTVENFMNTGETYDYMESPVPTGRRFRKQCCPQGSLAEGGEAARSR